MTEKPLIIAYFDGDEEVKLLSNFAPTPFVLDGRKYGTVESFWQSLKFDDEIMRNKVASLTEGVDAKQMGKFAPIAQVFLYEGDFYRIASQEHHILLERAIRAKVAQNENVEIALRNSHPRLLKHMIKNRFGTWRAANSPALPAVTFERILTKIRNELIMDIFNPDLPLPSGFNVSWDS